MRTRQCVVLAVLVVCGAVQAQSPPLPKWPDVKYEALTLMSKLDATIKAAGKSRDQMCQASLEVTMPNSVRNFRAIRDRATGYEARGEIAVAHREMIGLRTMVRDELDMLRQKCDDVPLPK